MPWVRGRSGFLLVLGSGGRLKGRDRGGGKGEVEDERVEVAYSMAV